MSVSTPSARFTQCARECTELRAHSLSFLLLLRKDRLSARRARARRDNSALAEYLLTTQYIALYVFKRAKKGTLI